MSTSNVEALQRWQNNWDESYCCNYWQIHAKKQCSPSIKQQNIRFSASDVVNFLNPVAHVLQTHNECQS